MNYFELYPGDYLRDTTRLTLLEHGAYLRLLMTYYSEETPLSADDDELFVVVSAITPADRAAVRKVADRFFPVGADGLRHNSRADAEIQKAQKRISNARNNGSKNKATKNPPGNPPGNPLGMPVGNPAGNPVGVPRVDPADTQRHTHSGEALHTPPTKQEQEQESKPATVVAHPSADDYSADLWRRWKALPDGGGGAYLAKLIREHGEQPTLEAVERTLDAAPAEPKSYVKGLLRKAKQDDDALDDIFRSAR